MNSATEYQSVPTTTTRTKGSRGEKNFRGLFLVILFLGFSAPFIIFGILGYNNARNFDTQPSSCRVNAVGSERKTQLKSRSSVFPVWNVDIVKQSKSNSAAKDLVILRSSLKIWGSGDYRSLSSAVEDAEQLYSVGKIYPCYVYKRLLTDVANDKERINFKEAIQWEKPARKMPFLLLSIGLSLIVVGIIVTIFISVINWHN